MKLGQSASGISSASFMVGVTAVMAQVLYTRELFGVFSGNEMAAAILFFFWFAGIAAGSYFLARVPVLRRDPRAACGVLLAFLPPLMACHVAFVRCLRAFFGIEPGASFTFDHAVLVFALTALPAGLLVGACLASLFEAASPAGARRGDAGKVYVIDSLGSLAGGVLFTFLLAGRWDAMTTLSALWALDLAAVALLLRERPKRVWTFLAAVAILWCAAFAARLPARLDAHLWDVRWRGLAPGYEFRAGLESTYKRLDLGERDGQFALFGDGTLSAVFPDPLEESMRANLYMNQCRNPRSVLLAGEGLEGEALAVLKYPVERLTALYMDPAYPGLLGGAAASRIPRDPRFRVVGEDPVQFLKRTSEFFDIVVLRPPPPSSASCNRLYTKEFFDLCKYRMAPGGLLTVSLEAADQYLGGVVEEYVAGMYHTLRDVFPEVEAAPGVRPSFFASASPGYVSMDPLVLEGRYRKWGLREDGYFTPHHFRLMVEPERTAWVGDVLSASTRGGVNTMARPFFYFTHMRVWASIHGSWTGKVMEPLGGLKVVHVASGAVAVFLLAAGWRRIRRRRWGRKHCASGESGSESASWSPPDGAGCPAPSGATALGIWVFGLLGMAWEILLIYLYQNMYGSLFSKMGALVAAFMGGLTFGAHVMRRRCDRGGADGLRLWYLWLLPLSATGLSAVVLATFHWPSWATQSVIVAEMAAAGALTGAYFPLACALDDRPSAPARTNSADYLGAMAGALLTGAVFMPVLGVPATCLTLAALPLSIPLWALSGGANRPLRGHASARGSAVPQTAG